MRNADQHRSAASRPPAGVRPEPFCRGRRADRIGCITERRHAWRLRRRDRTAAAAGDPRTQPRLAGARPVARPRRSVPRSRSNEHLSKCAVAPFLQVLLEPPRLVSMGGYDESRLSAEADGTGRESDRRSQIVSWRCDCLALASRAALMRTGRGPCGHNTWSGLKATARRRGK